VRPTSTALALVLLLSSLLSAQQRAVHPRRLLVALEPGVESARIEPTHRHLGASVLFDLPQIGWQVVELPAGRIEQARAGYAAHPAVRRVDRDRARRVAHVPNDPYWPLMWHMTQIGADHAWDSQLGDPSVTVAVIDTGIEVAHPDLAANVWVNPGEIPGNWIDDDQNGYIDDVHGWDFAYLDPDPDDQYGHGTACAGIVASVQDNGEGACGVAPRCTVAAIKASLDSGYFYDSALVPAYVYCADMGFDVLSMSFFSDEVTPAQRDAIEYCWALGVLPVAAAANSNSVIPQYPAAYDEVLAVGGSDSGDGRLWFSNLGSWVGVAAPGINICTSATGGGYTTGFAGTSGAAPHVAGLAGMLFAADPSATNADVRAAIEDGAWPISGDWVAYGRIDCPAALDRLFGVTTGSVPAELDFVSPCGGGLRLLPSGAAPAGPEPIVVGGVGFEPPNPIQASKGGAPLSVLSQSRHRLELALSDNKDGSLAIDVGGQALPTIEWEGGMGLVYAPSDAGTDWGGGVVSGGFLELYRDDGSELTCTRRDDGTVYLELVFRGVGLDSPWSMSVELTRAWEDCAGGVETIELYDWSSASYPYGNFTTISQTPIAGSAMSTLVVDVPGAPADYVDDAGTVYARITATSAGPAGRLRADSLRLRAH